MPYKVHVYANKVTAQRCVWAEAICEIALEQTNMTMACYLCIYYNILPIDETY